MCNVSVIVPVYNGEKYLRACLESLAAQTLEDIEIIVVNDGSTDGSLAIAEEFVTPPQKNSRLYDRKPWRKPCEKLWSVKVRRSVSCFCGCR